MNRLIAVSVCLTALSLASCSKSNGQKPTFPVAGQVLYNGQPAQNAMVIFHPEGDEPDAVKPRGKVAADGSYKLTTYTTDDGAPEGKYKVTVEWWLTKGGDAPPTNRLPEKYSNAAGSGLTATVNAAATDIAPIKLTR